MNAYDLFVISFYLGLLVYIGYKSSIKLNTFSNFTIGSKTSPWWAIGLSVMATYVSALSFLGGPAWAYNTGMSALMIHVNYPLVIFVCVAFFIPLLYKNKIVSIYDYCLQRFGKLTQIYMSLLFCITTSIAAGSIISATSIALGYALDIDILTSIFLIVLVVSIYTSYGGMDAVIWTDVLQTVIFIGGALIVFVMLLYQLDLGNSLSYLNEADKLSPIIGTLDFDIATTVYAGVFAMTIYHITVYGTNQMLMQRALGAKNIVDAKKGYLFMGYSAFFVYVLFFSIGALLFAYYQGATFENTNTIILHYINQQNIPGLLGLISVAVLSASMSSTSSALNSLTTVTIADFLNKSKTVRMARITNFLWAVLLIPIAIWFANSTGSVLVTLSAVGSYFVGAKFAVFFLGMFSKNVKETDLLLGIVTGFLAVWYVATTTDVAWPWYAVIGSIVNILVSYVISFRNENLDWHFLSIPYNKDTLEISGATYGLLGLFVWIISVLLLLGEII